MSQRESRASKRAKTRFKSRYAKGEIEQVEEQKLGSKVDMQKVKVKQVEE
jgi:uncharacterized membrane protein